jgi:hypothetical protein
MPDVTYGDGLRTDQKHFEQNHLFAHQQQELERLYEVQQQAALQQQMAMQQSKCYKNNLRFFSFLFANT